MELELLLAWSPPPRVQPEAPRVRRRRLWIQETSMRYSMQNKKVLTLFLYLFVTLVEQFIPKTALLGFEEFNHFLH